MPTIPIALNINNIESTNVTSAKELSVAHARDLQSSLACGLQLADALVNVVSGFVTNAVNDVLAHIGLSYLTTTNDIENAVIAGPIAFKSAANFQFVNDNGIVGVCIARNKTVEEASAIINSQFAAGEAFATLMTDALPETGYVGAILSTLDFDTQLQEIMYCFYNYGPNDRFDWYEDISAGIPRLRPVPVNPSSLRPVISSLVAAPPSIPRG